MCHFDLLSLWIHWGLMCSYCPDVYRTDGGLWLRNRMEDMALHRCCETYRIPYMRQLSMELSEDDRNELRNNSKVFYI